MTKENISRDFMLTTQNLKKNNKQISRKRGKTRAMVTSCDGLAHYNVICRSVLENRGVKSEVWG